MKRRYHIIIDSWNIDSALLNDSKLIEKTIRDLVKLCGMKILFGPSIIQGVPENPGVTCFTVIDFSHISIHTFTDTREICIDVFSCKKFDKEAVKNYIVNTFHMKSRYTKVVEVKY